jgi:ribulose-5-phosphate 4-epimerase/fuculose-1-phosphate aldolase
MPASKSRLTRPAPGTIPVDAEGCRVEGERQPSSETDVHLVVYRRRPGVNAIVHTAPVYSNVLGVPGQPVEAVLINMVIYPRGPVPVMPSSSTEFGEVMVKVLRTRNAVIWGNHGLMTADTSRRKDETTYASYALRSRRAPDQCDSAVSSISVLDAAGSSAASASI